MVFQISEKGLPWLRDALYIAVFFPSSVCTRVCYVAVLGHFAQCWQGICVGEIFSLFSMVNTEQGVCASVNL